MANFYHGVRSTEVPTSYPAPVKVTSGIPFVVGTAPIHMVGGKVNEPILVESFEDAAKALGYSDDWEKFTLCEMVYAKYALYSGGPMVLVNVLDPNMHKKAADEHEVQLQNGMTKLDASVILSTLKVAASSGGEALKKDTDYDAFYDGGKLVVEITKDGAAKDKTCLFVSYDEVDTTSIMPEDIIGGFDSETKKRSGFELIEEAYSQCGVVPDLLLAPGFSDNASIAAVMAAKAENINGIFCALAIVDVDSDATTWCGDVPAKKATDLLTSKNQVLVWPMVSYSGKRYHMSTHAAALITKVDTEYSAPCTSPSNNKVIADGVVLKDGAEVTITLPEANALNANGICTVLSFSGVYRFWGNCTACYPENSDYKDCFVPVRRMFDWVGKHLILSYWSKIDKPMTRRLVDSIVDSCNIWLNGLVADEKLLGARVEFREDENSDEDIAAGIMKFHIHMTPHTPAQEIDFVLEYDAACAETALA